MSKENTKTDETASLRLVRFNWSCGRMGDLSGMFVLGPKGWSEWQSMVAGKVSVYFGEVLGKHSEVEGAVEPHDFEVVSTDQGFCTTWSELGCDNGYNPLDYLPDEDDDGGQS